MVRLNGPFGAGSQFASLSLPGLSFWRYRSSEPSASRHSLLLARAMPHLQHEQRTRHERDRQRHSRKPHRERSECEIHEPGRRRARSSQRVIEPVKLKQHGAGDADEQQRKQRDRERSAEPPFEKVRPALVEPRRLELIVERAKPFEKSYDPCEYAQHAFPLAANR